MRVRRAAAIAALAAVAMVLTVSGCGKQGEDKTQESEAASTAESTAGTRKAKESRNAAMTEHYGSEEYDRIPDKLKDKKAYENISRRDLEYNRELVESVRDNIVIEDDK